MRSPKTLRDWMRQLLPEATPVAQQAAGALVRALLVGFTTHLSQLARHLDRPGTAKGARQWLQRWLDRPQLAPEAFYPRLLQLVPHAVWDQRQLLLLIDTTCLSDRWVVLQVSLPWEGRALPVWRVVYPYCAPGRGQAAALTEALRGLKKHLPGPQSRYVLVMDRGFPSNPLVTFLRQEGWRFVLRVKSNWRMEHPGFTGLLRDAVALGLVTGTPLLLEGAALGCREKGRDRRSQANVVFFSGEEHAEAWFLVTSESDAEQAVAIYRRRMQIEQEFRDLKGPVGLDALAEWHALPRVACFLAWLAVYEWRLAFLWVTHRLAAFRPQLRVGGPISWIRATREWVARQLRLATPLPDLRL
ncbi:MAG TPA: transposase [Armatimonadota bacterium]|nr:transposase [Armatimonadota bacterium]